jgi:hypothetical protein
LRNGAADQTIDAAPAVAVDGPTAADFIRSFLRTPVSGQLPGVPLSLGGAVRDAATRRDQTERARAYWELSAEVAHYYLALQERLELAGLRQSVQAPSAAWDAASDESEGRVERSRHAVSAAQLRLHGLMGRSVAESLPLPADSPHCGRYNTRHDEIFAARPDAGAQQLDVLLPLLHSHLTSAARSINEAHQWLTFVSENRDPTTDGTGLLRAFELWSLRRRELIDAAREYNQQIAAYTELAAPGQVDSNRLVAMLIRVSTAAGADGIQQTGATEDDADRGAAAGQAVGASPGNDAGRPRTFADRLRFEARRPTLSGLLGREHSIVVDRLLLRNPRRNR